MRPSSIVIAVAIHVSGMCWGQESWILGGEGGHSWSEVAELNALGDASTAPGALQPWELRPDENLLPRVSERFTWSPRQVPQDPFWSEGMPRFWRGRKMPGQMEPISRFVDGDPYTLNSVVKFLHTTGEYYTIDPGGLVPLERFVIRLPPEFDPVTGDPDPRCCDPHGKPYAFFVPHRGELTASQIETQEMLLRRTVRSSRYGNYVPLPISLGSVEQHLVAPLTIDFPLQYLRFVRWRSFPDDILTYVWGATRPLFDALAYAEFELYGRGFAGETRYRSKVLDLGRPVTLGRLFMAVTKWRRQGSRWVETTDANGNVQRRWQVGELVEATDAAVEVSLRLRNGTDDDPHTYFTWNDTGDLEEIARVDWDGLEPRKSEVDAKFVGWQGPVTEDFESWSPWSSPIRQAVTRLDLPSRRFFQLELMMTSSRPRDMARLDSLWIEFFPVLVPNLVGEVGVLGQSQAGLLEVPIGEPTELVYAIRAGFLGAAGVGFDAVHIASLAEPEFLQLLRGDSPAGAQEVAPDTVWTDRDGLTLYLPEPVQGDETLWIGLRTALYTVAAQLRGEVFNRDNSHMRQMVEEGNATDHIHTNRLQVVAAGEAVEQIIGALEIQPPTFTPNGDGSNDRTQLKYSLFGVLDAEVEIFFYTLAGEPVHRIIATNLEAGIHTVPWDGRDATGRLLDPGLYLCQVKAQTGRGRFAIVRPVAVAY